LSSTPRTTLTPGDNWKTGKVKIRVPCAGFKQHKEDAPEFTVDGLLYCDAIEVITNKLMVGAWTGVGVGRVLLMIFTAF